MMNNPAFEIELEEIQSNDIYTKKLRSCSKKPTLATIPSGVPLEFIDPELPMELGLEVDKKSLVTQKDGWRSVGASLRNSFRRGRSGLHRISNRAQVRTKNYRKMKKETRTTSQEPADESIEKIGRSEGVLMRSLFNIWGAILFLRVSWIVSQSGIWQTLLIIGFSTFITLITTLSLSAITANCPVSGGTYYGISRVLGPELGGPIGILFVAVNAMNAALNIVGFVQSLQALMQQYGVSNSITDSDKNDIRTIGGLVLVAVTLLCGPATKYEAKSQTVLMVILMVTLVNFIVGSCLGPKSDLEHAKGFWGFNEILMRENWRPGYIDVEGQMQNFFSVFSIYFPGGISILAAANVSGLSWQDHKGAIPIGTVLMALITSVLYAMVAIVCGTTMKRAATGSINDFHNSTHFHCNAYNCTFGSYHDYQSMTLISAYGPLNSAGCLVATLSSAMVSYISCPKILQAIGDDRAYPYWMVGILTKGYGVTREPIRAYVFTFFFTLIFVLIAHFNLVAMVVTEFVLITFTLLNYATFRACLVKPLGWRPPFKFYSMWLSLLIAIVCIVTMFMVNWLVAVIVIIIVAFFYLFAVSCKIETTHGSLPLAQSYCNVLNNIRQLTHIDPPVRSYRPQVLVLTGLPRHRPALVDFANLICKDNSLMFSANIVKNYQTPKDRSMTISNAQKYLLHNDIKAFYLVIDAMDFDSGVRALLEVNGIGKMQSNVLLMGFKRDWATCDIQSLEKYFAVIHTCLELHVGIAIIRVSEGFDCSEFFAGGQDAQDDTVNSTNNHGASSNASALKHTWFNKAPRRDNVLRDAAGNELSQHIIDRITYFQKRIDGGTIDIWWLCDDGGLTVILPYIISKRWQWASCRLRLFCTISSCEATIQQKNRLTELLVQLRIQDSDVIVVNERSRPPRPATRIWFNEIIRNFAREEDDPSGCYISENQRRKFKAQTDRQLRLRELLQCHSSDSKLIVMTLPIHLKGDVSVALYSAWLETLTADMPPFLLVRGNQSPVLTFYS